MKKGCCNKQPPFPVLCVCKEGGGGDNIKSRIELSHTFVLFLFLATDPCPVFILLSLCHSS